MLGVAAGLVVDVVQSGLEVGLADTAASAGQQAQLYAAVDSLGEHRAVG